MGTINKIEIIRNLIHLENKKNEKEVIYKKTASSFKKKYGVELSTAPMVFVSNSIIWKLSHHSYKYSGRTHESAEYLPIVGCQDFFKRMENPKIKLELYEAFN